MSAVPDNATNRILLAVERLKAFDRHRAVDLLAEELAEGAASGERWRSVAKLASNIGELTLSHEAARRYAATQPETLERKLSYCRELIRDGLVAQALVVVDELPTEVQEHSSVLHLRGTIATQVGEFSRAESLFRKALDLTPLAPQSWFALSVIKTFSADDRDITAMEALKPDMLKGPARLVAQFCYALGKAYDDAGDTTRAYSAYREGAALMQAEEPFDGPAMNRFADQLIREFHPEKLDLLRPSGCKSDRVIFVNGVPRSGTTLVEQILTSHSQVADGAELNLMRAALIPTGDHTLLGALNYQLRDGMADPWGRLGQDYMGMIEQRFGPGGRIVDKTLNHSRFMALLLHTLPKAQVVWLRRRPEDCALSCFRTFFTAPVPWSWRASNIAAFLKAEDRLHAHWTALFPDRILTVPYEDLVSSPEVWIRRILAHVDLPEEPQVFTPHTTKRSVMTASVAQVRGEISTARIGAAEAYGDFVTEFRSAYYGE